MDRLRLGLVGYGYWGPNLVRNIQEAKDMCVVACCDANPDRLAQLKVKYPSIEATTDYDALLNDPAVDAIVISTAHDDYRAMDWSTITVPVVDTRNVVPPSHPRLYRA